MKFMPKTPAQHREEYKPGHIKRGRENPKSIRLYKDMMTWCAGCAAAGLGVLCVTARPDAGPNIRPEICKPTLMDE
ncbi:hypothetical protein DAPPUDRAFT_251903 [Daphnia pulex]|uniref:Uncharacterized protein n=1 Tax=Daphnia pulex TaxID=6669 RepID=E9H1N0_DAPPU|nr:hypothetical protein DAPPUDRAFT_251903 [Daphnia pulex]|eukprot:EFX74379.1 hypothetical protein DAPPUDRAFT_251903 [Daphnia pulex]